jgi:hypothetical protein
MKLNSVMMSNTLDTGHPLSHMVSPTLKLQTHYGASDMVTQTRVQPRHEPGHLTATFRQAFVAPKGGISGSARNAAHAVHGKMSESWVTKLVFSIVVLLIVVLIFSENQRKTKEINLEIS